MEIIIVIFLGVLIALIIGLFFYIKETPNKDNDNSTHLLLTQINELSRTIDGKLGESQKEMTQSMRHQSTETSRIIADITEKITRLDETNKQVVSFADQLQSLQDILKNPKQRGILGEYYLETLLKNVLPTGRYQMQYPFSEQMKSLENILKNPKQRGILGEFFLENLLNGQLAPEQFKMQYKFKNGEIVDAAIFVREKIIPVDAKFSLENYNRMMEEKSEEVRDKMERKFKEDLKLRIDETSKYVRTSEDTTDFAFMFIPHEAIYYDLLINKIGLVTEDTENLIQRAASKYKVIIVSPTSFLAYLQTVLQGLKAMQIEESAKDIVKRVGELGNHLRSYE